MHDCCITKYYKTGEIFPPFAQREQWTDGDSAKLFQIQARELIQLDNKYCPVCGKDLRGLIDGMDAWEREVKN